MLVREGEYVAEVDVDLIDDPPGWEPYLSLEDAEKLDCVRSALKADNPRAAARVGRVVKLTPIEVA
jgi:hypothetical protein